MYCLLKQAVYVWWYNQEGKMLANKRITGKGTKDRVVSCELVRLLATILVVIGHSNYLSMTIKYGGVDYTSFPAADVLSNLFFL